MSESASGDVSAYANDCETSSRIELPKHIRQRIINAIESDQVAWYKHAKGVIYLRIHIGNVDLGVDLGEASLQKRLRVQGATSTSSRSHLSPAPSAEPEDQEVEVERGNGSVPQARRERTPTSEEVDSEHMSADSHNSEHGYAVQNSQDCVSGEQTRGHAVRLEIWRQQLQSGTILARSSYPWLPIGFGISLRFLNSVTLRGFELVSNVNTRKDEHLAGYYQRGAYVAVVNETVVTMLKRANITITNIFCNGNVVRSQAEQALQEPLRGRALGYILAAQASKGKDLNQLCFGFFENVHKFPLALFLRGGKLSSASTLLRSIAVFADAFHSYLKPVRSLQGFQERITPHLYEAMSMCGRWLEAIAERDSQEFRDLDGVWMEAGPRGQERRWSVGDGDGIYICVGGVEYDVRINPTDAMEFGFQLGSDIAASALRTFWTYGWRVRCSVLYRYHQRIIAKVDLKKVDENVYDVSMTLLSLGVTYPYYHFFIGTNTYVDGLIQGLECAVGAASIEPSAEQPRPSQDQDEGLDTISRVIRMWDCTTILRLPSSEATKPYPMVRPELLFGDVEANLATKVDVEAYHRGQGFNIWAVHADVGKLVLTNNIPEPYRQAWGLKEAYTFLPTWPRDVKARLGECATRETRRSKRLRERQDILSHQLAVLNDRSSAPQNV